MTRLDRRDLPLSTTSDLAAERYREGVDLLLSAWPGAAEALEAAIAIDRNFALAHAARARLHAIRGEPADDQARITAPEALVARYGPDREPGPVGTPPPLRDGTSDRTRDAAPVPLSTRPRHAQARHEN